MIKWAGTILCLIGIGLTSANIYPLNLALGLTGSALWTLAGFVQRDPPLILVEAAAVVMYLAGLAAWLVS